MKNVLLLGASGTLGKAVTEKLLSETDLKLTLFAHHASDVYTEGKAAVIDGDATGQYTLKDAMVHNDVIVCIFSKILHVKTPIGKLPLFYFFWKVSQVLFRFFSCYFSF